MHVQKCMHVRASGWKHEECVKSTLKCYVNNAYAPLNQKCFLARGIHEVAHQEHFSSSYALSVRHCRTSRLPPSLSQTVVEKAGLTQSETSSDK